MDSQYFAAGMLAGLLLAFLVALLLSVFVGGALLRASLRWLEGIAPGYLRCCGAVALGLMFGGVAQFVLGGALSLLPGIVAALTRDPGLAAMAAMSLLGLLLTVAMLALATWLVVPRADGTRLAPTRALGAAAITTAIGFALYAAILTAFLLSIGGIPGVPR